MFSFFTFIIGFATNVYQFAVYRFIAGLGLGGVMPNAIALMSEYAPLKLKSTLVSIMFSGYSLGGIMAAGLGILLIPVFGWKSLFFIGGLPLLAIPFMIKSLPESPHILVVKNETKKLQEILEKVNPTYSIKQGMHFTTHVPEKEKGNLITKLFANGRALSTLMIWTAFFMCLLMIYGLNTWLPELMRTAGYPLGSSISFLLVLNLGAIFGAIFGGRIADKWSAKKVLILFFVLGAVSISLLGFKTNMFILYILVATAGASTIGSQIISNAYTTQHYPGEIRSSAIGYSRCRPFRCDYRTVNGGLLHITIADFSKLFAFAIPGVIGALAISFVQERYSSAVQLRKVEKAFIKTN